MPKHRQVQNCLRGGKTSDYCGCAHCTLGVCEVCGCYEGSLTTHCPGEKVPSRVQELINEDLGIDWLDGVGWCQNWYPTMIKPEFDEETKPPPINTARRLTIRDVAVEALTRGMETKPMIARRWSWPADRVLEISYPGSMTVVVTHSDGQKSTWRFFPDIADAAADDWIILEG